MKKTIFCSILIVASMAAGCIIYTTDSGSGAREGRGDSGYGDLDVSYFYEYLAPYGTWVNYSPYGYVWIPRHMRFDWRPYSYGRWAWTDYGWTWVSGYEWGWVAFHYGRWGWDRGLGWFWVPDTIWGPAWVTWRRGDFYIGWAALSPDVEFIPGYGIRSRSFSVPASYWVFIDGRYFLDDRLDRYILPYERNMTIINFTVINTNIYVRDRRIINEGLDADYVRRRTQRVITKYQLRDPQRPESARLEAGDLILYRPSLSGNQSAKPRVALSRDQAQEKISSGELRGPESLPDESALREEQKRERKLLEESQAFEVKEIKRKIDQDKKLVRNAEEKKHLDEEYDAKVSSLKKKHEEEKTELTQRHKKEEDQVNKDRLKKKKKD